VRAVLKGLTLGATIRDAASGGGCTGGEFTGPAPSLCASVDSQFPSSDGLLRSCWAPCACVARRRLPLTLSHIYPQVRCRAKTPKGTFSKTLFWFSWPALRVNNSSKLLLISERKLPKYKVLVCGDCVPVSEWLDAQRELLQTCDVWLRHGSPKVCSVSSGYSDCAAVVIERPQRASNWWATHIVSLCLFFSNETCFANKVLPGGVAGSRGQSILTDQIQSSRD
jgi:hypothetical protein